MVNLEEMNFMTNFLLSEYSSFFYLFQGVSGEVLLIERFAAAETNYFWCLLKNTEEVRHKGSKDIGSFKLREELPN